MFHHRRREVITISVDPAKCIGCESCVSACRRKVFEMKFGLDIMYYAWAKYPNDCVGCGKCQRVCMAAAIDLKTV
ncbi:MAG: ferredoxin family protein [Bacteroides sp.]|nr:ferredoxin family protein [Bacteroides sp.]